MSTSSGTLKNLNDSRVQALQALLNSVVPDAGTGLQTDASKLTSEQLAQLSDKLGDILGENSEIIHGGSDGTKRNEKGELVNEDGLPIIDISEPLAPSGPEITFPTGSNVDDPEFLPLWALSSTEKERRKAERERLLDLLEEEERLEQAKEDAVTRERIRAGMEKRKEAGKAELERLKKAKELQKKMGRALVRTVVEAKDEVSSEPQSPDVSSSPQRPKTGKSVSFADQVEESKLSSDKGKSVDRGDVTLGRLRSPPGNLLLTKSQSDTQTMKMQVVERVPGAPMKSPTPEPVQPGDSDDESIPDEYLIDSEEDSQIPYSEDEDGLGPDDDEPVSWEEDDLDFARHQREVALAYYEKRAAMVGEVTATMKAHSHDGEDEWDQPDVPLEATLASTQPKPSVSKFKSSLVNRAATTTMASHSLGQAILPASQTPSLKSAIRMGKLEDGKLVGGEAGESGDEMEEEVKEIIELLKKGEVTNIGPQTSASQPTQPSSQPQVETPAPKPPSKLSRFKAAIASGSSSPTLSSPSDSNFNTPISLAERSSPKLATPIAVPTTVSRPPPKAQAQPTRSSRPSNTQTSVPHSSTLKATVEPPSLSSNNKDANDRAAAGLTPESFHPVTNPFSNIIDSPSFLPAGIIESTEFQSMIIDPSKSNNEPRSSTTALPKKAPPTVQKVTERPAVVMSAEVKESKPINRDPPKPEKSQRVSRFMAERI